MKLFICDKLKITQKIRGFAITGAISWNGLGEILLSIQLLPHTIQYLSRLKRMHLKRSKEQSYTMIRIY